MTGTDLELAETNSMTTFEAMGPSWELAERIADTEFVPKALRKRPHAVMACVLAGHELGIQPMQSLGKIHMVEGRPTMSAEMMRAVVLHAGHEIRYGKVTNTAVVVKGRRAEDAGDEDAWQTIGYTMDDAKTAGLAGKSNWKRMPMDMLLARATARLCRLIFPDVLGGLSYTPEEVSEGDVVDYDDMGTAATVEVEAERGEEPEAIQAPPKQKKKRAAKKKAAPKKAAPTQGDGKEPEFVQPTMAPPPPAPAADDEDEVVEAEIVEDDEGGTPEEPPPSDDEAPPRTITPAQRFAMLCGQAGLDDDARHNLVAVITGGRASSSNDLTEAEMTAAITGILDPANNSAIEIASTGKAFTRLEDREPLYWHDATLRLVTADEYDQLDDAELADTGITWDEIRTAFREAGAGNPLRWADGRAKELGIDPPGTGPELAAHPVLAAEAIAHAGGDQ